MLNNHNLTLSKRCKTISWKFKEIASNYPELKAAQHITINSPDSFYLTFKFLFHQEVKEKCVVFWLNSANKIMGYEIVSIGTLNSSVIHPREVFRGAIVSSCVNIIIAHNHPGGDPSPSAEDVFITKQLIEAGKIIDIRVLDHFIFAGNSFHSFNREKTCKF